MDSNFFGLLTFIFIIIANSLALYMKHIVGQNGYETHLFSGHWQAIADFQKLINQKNNKPDVQVLEP